MCYFFETWCIYFYMLLTLFSLTSTVTDFELSPELELTAHLSDYTRCPQSFKLATFSHFWRVPLGAKRRHQSPEWTILSHVSFFIQGEVIRFQVLLDSLHPRYT